MSWQRWNWLSDGALPLAVGILRACWLWAWLGFAQRWLTPSYKGTLLPALLMVLLFLGSVATTRWTLARVRNLTYARIGVTAVGFVAMLSILWWLFYHAQYHLWDPRWVGTLGVALAHWGDEVPPPFVTALVTAYLWLRGELDGREPLTHDDIWGVFVTGFAALALFVLVATVGDGGPLGNTGNLVMLFFAVGMAALALADLEEIRRPKQQAGEIQVELNRYWLVSILSVIVGLLGLGLLLGVLIAPETVAKTLSWTRIILNALGHVLYYVALAFSYLLFLVLGPLIGWARRAISKMPPAKPVEFPRFEQPLREQPQNVTGMPPGLSEALSWGALAVFLLLIGLAFALALRRFLRGAEEEIDETRELIVSRDLLQQQLSTLWHNWLQRFRRSPRRVLSPFLPLEGEPDARGVIRAIYQALLAKASDVGLPRARGQTPIAYRHTLEEAWPNVRDALRTMTDEYLQARYAPQLPTPEQTERTRQAWAQVQAWLEPPSDSETDKETSNPR
ncbi:MAG TPA: DUF4129 domain-containing protein [Anaerolineae bacterium]|nr:DUF4129 domain-containing protein [Anaerolineae bacterium]HIQ06808.1 DUF4129 domain-containing protein [Anaerolineae bacterium]